MDIPSMQDTHRVQVHGTLVIFGASGDLARRKLVPALYSLEAGGLLPKSLNVIGVDLTPMADDAFRGAMRQSCEELGRQGRMRTDVWDRFATRLSYYQGGVTDLSSMEGLAGLLRQKDAARGGGGKGSSGKGDGGGDRIFYLSVPPDVYPDALRTLGASKLVSKAARHPAHRVVVEKPFGRDLQSARELNEVAMAVLREDQLYRIDHYLGKETVQNLLVFRFGNAIWEPLWNRNHIDHVQVTAAESIGVEGRGAFYERTGVLRDVVQNHLLQVLSLVTMEPPISFEADAVRDQKAQALRCLRPMTPADVRRWTVRGQYGPGKMNGWEVPGYRQEPNVAPDSQMPTFVAIRLFFDDPRWEGVPFYLRAGKRLATRVTEVSILFRQASHVLFGAACPEPNVLTLRIQPNEGISLHFALKVPGSPMEVVGEDLDFRYQAALGSEPPEAYERLLLDAIRGEATLFVRDDEVEAAWRFITPILQAWEEQPPAALPNYAPGSWGPPEVDALIKADGRVWWNPRVLPTHPRADSGGHRLP